MVNTMLALRRTYKFIDKVYWRALVTGLVPMTVVGVIVLHSMSGAFYQALKIMLGFVIISAGGMLMFKPAPFAQRFVLFPAVGAIDLRASLCTGPFFRSA